MEKLAKAMEARGFLISCTFDFIYFSLCNTRDELLLIERMFKEIGCDIEIEDRKIRPHNPLTEEQLERIIWYPARNHEVGPTHGMDSWKYFVKRKHGAKVNTFVLETGVARLVKSLSAAGFSTFNSCDGHGKKSPFITFSGPIQATWFELLFTEAKRDTELNYDWNIKWDYSMGPSLVANKTSKTQQWNLLDVLEDTLKMADFFYNQAEQITSMKREIFGKQFKTTRKTVKTMSIEELYKWMADRYSHYKGGRLIID